jgi:hypothetical protein
MKMQASDYHVYEKGPDFLLVVGDMLSFGMEWPDTIAKDGRVYRFRTNEVMEDWMVGRYYGHARYEEQNEK